MTRLNFAHLSGVIVDECPKHGIWLDQGELRKIAEFVAAGGLRDIRDLDVVSPAFRGRAKKGVVTKCTASAKRPASRLWLIPDGRLLKTPDLIDVLELLLYVLHRILR